MDNTDDSSLNTMQAELIDNAFHHQKDGLYAQIKRGENGIRNALVILESCAELWCILGYAYKGREIIKVIQELLVAEREQLHHRAINRHMTIRAQLQLAADLTKVFCSPVATPEQFYAPPDESLKRAGEQADKILTETVQVGPTAFLNIVRPGQ